MFVLDDPIDLSELIVRIPYRGRMNLSFWNAITREADAIDPNFRSIVTNADLYFLPAKGGLQGFPLNAEGSDAETDILLVKRHLESNVKHERLLAIKMKTPTSSEQTARLVIGYV
jgi:hypothetical protein